VSGFHVFEMMHYIFSSLIFFPFLIQHLSLFTSNHTAKPVEPGRDMGEMFDELFFFIIHLEPQKYSINSMRTFIYLPAIIT
jgi:hypothetical protein